MKVFVTSYRRRTHKHIDPDHPTGIPNPKKHNTFIMTTMYREGRQEMQNLMTSLLHIDTDMDEWDHFEAHITFDNAFLRQGVSNIIEMEVEILLEILSQYCSIRRS
jgi:hypothetical protein